MRALNVLWAAGLLVAAVSASGREPPSPPLAGRALLASEFMAGSLWGKTAPETARRLNSSRADSLGRLSPTWFLDLTFARLWGLSEEGRGDFDTVEVSSGCWILLHQGKTFGYLQKIPIDDWESFELPARKRFGREPERLHFSVDAATAPVDTPRFMHIYRWKGSPSQFYIMKMAPIKDTKRWRSAAHGTDFRVQVMQKIGDDSVPTYVMALSSKKERAFHVRPGQGAAPRPR